MAFSELPELRCKFGPMIRTVEVLDESSKESRDLLLLEDSSELFESRDDIEDLGMTVAVLEAFL